MIPEFNDWIMEDVLASSFVHDIISDEAQPLYHSTSLPATAHDLLLSPTPLKRIRVAGMDGSGIFATSSLHLQNLLSPQRTSLRNHGDPMDALPSASTREAAASPAPAPAAPVAIASAPVEPAAEDRPASRPVGRPRKVHLHLTSPPSAPASAPYKSPEHKKLVSLVIGGPSPAHATQKDLFSPTLSSLLTPAHDAAHAPEALRALDLDRERLELTSSGIHEANERIAESLSQPAPEPEATEAPEGAGRKRRGSGGPPAAPPSKRPAPSAVQGRVSPAERFRVVAPLASAPSIAVLPGTNIAALPVGRYKVEGQGSVRIARKTRAQVQAQAQRLSGAQVASPSQARRVTRGAAGASALDLNCADDAALLIFSQSSF